MREWGGWLLKLIIPFILAAILINDVGVMVISRSQSKDIGKTIADDARANYASTGSEIEAYQAALKTAESYDVNLYGFKIANKKILIWMQVQPRKTIVIHRIESLKKKLTFNYELSYDL